MAKSMKETRLAELAIAKNNPKQTWNIFENIVPHKQPKKSSSYENPDEIAETFNDFFANVGKHTYDEVISERSKAPSGISETSERKEPTRHTSLSSKNPRLAPEIWSPKPASRAEIVSAIYSLKNTNSYGCDGITL